MNKLIPKREDIFDHSSLSVSLDRLKEHLRILDTDEDMTIQGYLMASTRMLEQWMGYDLMSARHIAYFNYSTSCPSLLVLRKRPFNSIESIEVWQNGQYVPLLRGYVVWQSGGEDLYGDGELFVSQDIDPSDDATYDYCVNIDQWETSIYISSAVQIDIDDACVDPVRVTYKTGKYSNIEINGITTTAGTPNIANVILNSNHDLRTYDQVIITESGNTIYNGLKTITVTGLNSFSFTYTGTAQGAVTTGICTIPRIPPELEQAIMMMVAKMYANRGDCADACGSIPCVAQSLASPYRRLAIKEYSKYAQCSC